MAADTASRFGRDPLTQYTREQRAVLFLHGADQRAISSGFPGEPDISWLSPGRIRVLMRFHICELDGVEIDGHKPGCGHEESHEQDH